MRTLGRDERRSRMSDSHIPARPSLEYDRKQARKFLKNLNNRDHESLARFCRGHPRFPDPASLDADEVALSDVQLVIAREYGFPSWPKWKQYVDITGLAIKERIEKFLVSVCSEQVSYASQLLKIDDSFTDIDLCAASASGNIPVLKQLLVKNSVNDDQGPLATTPLVYACQSRLLVTDSARREGIVECARLLLEAGADPNRGFFREGDEEYRQPQMAIYGAAGIANNPILTKLLLDAGANPNDGTEGKVGETLYHVAEFADTTCLELILKHNPEKAAVDYCLARAIDFGRPDAAFLFVEAGASVDYQVSWFNNETHLMKAIRDACDDGLIEAMMAKSSNLEMTDEDGATAYVYAVRFGHRGAEAALEAKGVDRSAVAAIDRFSGACLLGDRRSADAIIEDRPKVLSEFDPRVMKAAVRRANHDALTLLVNYGVPVDIVADMSALHQACFRGDFETTRLLVDLGASLTEKNVHGGTALGAVFAGSVMCHDPMGGPKALPPDSVAPRGFARIVDLLASKGAELPDTVSGSPAVIEVLQRYGVAS